MWHYKYLNIMKANYLFPAVFRKIGWSLLIPFGLLSICMNSLVWAILVNYLLLILATVFIYGAAYLSVAFVGLFTVLIFFIVKYRWDLYQFKKNGVEDE